MFTPHTWTMPNRSSKPKLPADVNQRGKAIVDFLTRDRDDEPEAAAEPVPDPPKPEIVLDLIREAARALGKLGGLKGGKARAARMTPGQRSEIAKKAAAARFKKKL